jgi:hypothetical protein
VSWFALRWRIFFWWERFCGGLPHELTIDAVRL